ncbi:MAG: 3-isopropylmalate dehydratase large subunit [Solirubrobacteraceae bacterium]|nr:3-isopropylmalate dehydratase large subunit [Solirubrobacteraceae bacterium]
MTAKILAAHGLEELTPGAFGLARVDRVLVNDVSGAVAIRELARMGAERVFDPGRVACVADHFWPAKDARSAEHVARLRAFAEAQGIEAYFEAGATPTAGIEHAVIAEAGLVRPGDLLVGGDSHTCTAGALGALGIGVGSTDLAAAMALGELWLRVPETTAVRFRGTPGPYATGKDLILALLGRIGVDGATYQALELSGPAIDALDVDGRLAVCNMAVEAGAKSGLVAADAATIAWLAPRLEDPSSLAPLAPDDGAAYEHEVEVDVDGMGPLVARPPSPGDVRPVDELGEAVRVDQVYVGNCANGMISDLRQLVDVVGGRRVAPGVRLIVVPATQEVHRQAVAEGLVEALLDAGAMVSPPTCGACFGGHMGVLAAGETAVATTNRNFRGRMGHRDSRVFLANAYVAGAAAVAGELVHPSEVVG